MNKTWFTFNLLGDVVKVTYFDIGFLVVEILSAIGFGIGIGYSHKHRQP